MTESEQILFTGLVLGWITGVIFGIWLSKNAGPRLW
jgi:ABC-type phosphate/phosphonate transport system permease subunit